MTQETKPNVGLRVRSFREQQGWSLRNLADRCGLSINAISRIERGENSPTVTSLTCLASVLSVPITDFFLDRTNHQAVLIKRGQGQSMERAGFIAQYLGDAITRQQLEAFIFHLDPFVTAHTSPVNHPGEEFVYCMEGEIEYCIREEIYHLQSGDSLIFEGMLPHHWRNPSTLPATLLLVFQASRDNSLARQRHQV